MIKLDFTEAEFNALAGLIDAGVRATGLRAVKEAAVILQKLEQAAGQAVPQAPADNSSEA